LVGTVTTIRRFEESRTHAVFRLLTDAERHLVKTLPAEGGRGLLKQVRAHLIETGHPLLETVIQEITGVKVVSLRHDISTTTGEEVVVFTLAGAPGVRDAKRYREE